MTRDALAALAFLYLLATPESALAGLATGLTAHYLFDGDATDASGNGNHGTEVGGPTYAPGHDNQAISLDGVNDLVQLPASLWQNDFSVAFWVQTSATAPSGSWWFEGLGMVDGEVCGAPPGGDFGIAMIDGGRVIVDGFKSTAMVNDGVFHAIAVTRSGTSVVIFIDGAVDASSTLGWAGPFTGMSWIGVGNNPCDAGFNRRWFPGKIDELRFYDRVLSLGEIQQLSGIQLAPTLSPTGMILFAALLMGTGLVGLQRVCRRAR